MDRISSAHPRLLVGEFGFSVLKRNAASPEGKAFKARLLHDAELLLGYPPQPRKMEGRRLLSASRNVLYRINTLAAAWLLSGGLLRLESVPLSRRRRNDPRPFHRLRLAV